MLWALSDVKPWNGAASLVDVRPDGSLLVHADGLYKSVDRGQSWEMLSPPPEGTRRLIPSRHDSRVLFALSNDSIMRTDNESAEWRRIDEGISNYTVTQIAVDGARPGRLYVLAYRLNEQHRHMFRSTDYGDTWSEVPCPELGLSWNALLRIDPRYSNRMYLVSGTIWVTVDAGATWEEFLTGTEPGTEASDLVVDPLSGRLLAASSTGLYLSETGSGRWSKISDKVFEQLARLDEDTLLARSAATIYRSSDGGTSWEEVLGGSDPRQIVGDPQNEAVAYAVVSAGSSWLLKTTDGGRKWQETAFGLSGFGYDMNWMIPLAASGRFLYYGVGGSGVFRSTDGGSSWHPINEGRSPAVPVALAVDPNNPEVVYLGTQGS